MMEAVTVFKAHFMSAVILVSTKKYTMNNEQTDLIRTVLSVLGGMAIFYVVFFVLKAWGKTKHGFLPQLVNKHIHFSGLFLTLIIMANYSLQQLQAYINPKVFGHLLYALKVLLIIASGFLLIKLVSFAKEM